MALATDNAHAASPSRYRTHEVRNQARPATGFNAFSGETLFPQQWLAVVVIVAWGIVAYGLLLWRLTQREA